MRRVMDLTEDGVLEHWNYGDPVEDWPIHAQAPLERAPHGCREVGLRQDAPQGTRPRLGGAPLLPQLRGPPRYTWSSTDDGTFRIPQVDTAIDCGRYVNPEGVRKQIEGAAIYGNSVAQFGKITTSKGAVVQSNFHDYPITRMNNAPLDVRVHIVEDFVHLRPCGVGEPGVPPYAPALVNAIHDATGKRIPRSASEWWRGPRRPSSPAVPRIPDPRWVHRRPAAVSGVSAPPQIRPLDGGP